MQLKRWVFRCFFYVLGLFFIALGSAFSINSNLGVSPVNSFPYAISHVTGFNLGVCVTVVYCVYVLIQMLLVGKLQLRRVLQVVFSTLFGYFMNFTRFLLGDFAIPTYAGQLCMLVISVFLIGLGLAFYLEADIVPLPLDGLALAVTDWLNKRRAEGKAPIPFHRIKITLDTTSASLALLISLIATGAVVGVREGTVISALTIGKVMSLLVRFVRPIVRPLCFGEAQKTQT